MDPYKVLGVSASSIKHESDLIPARKRAKTLFKRYSAEKKKFDAKKVLEAFQMIKQNLKGKVGEGQYKLLGRSRKERELDKHFNHQTKEIKNDKTVKRKLQAAQQGEKRMRLRGDKERVARPRRRRERRNQRKSQKVNQKKKKMMDSLQGLQKLSVFLESETKFPKAMPLLNRWVREYMNQDNRGYIFEVLHKLAKAEYVTEDADSRQEVIQAFEYVMGFFTAWFEEDESHQMLSWSWRLACVLSCHCFTDDAFMLSRTITTLNEALTLLETNKDRFGEETKLEMSPMSPGAMIGPPTPGGSDDDNKEPPGGSPPLGSPSLSDDGGADNEEMMEFYASMSSDDEDGEAAKVGGEKHEDGIKGEAEVDIKEETKVEIKEEFKIDIKEEKLGVKELKLEAKKGPAKKAAIEISLDSDDDKPADVIDSEDSVHDIDSGADDDSDAVFEELSSGSSSDVEEVDSSFKAPPVAASLRMMSEYFVFRCLGTLFRNRHHMWAQQKVDAFFQDVFYRRTIFSSAQIQQIEAWQARIKVLQKGGERGVGEANNILEAHRPVVDSREMRQVMDAAGGAWAAKQTFDSRDKCGGSNVIR